MSRSTVIFQPLPEVADLPHGLIDRHRTLLNPLIGEIFLAQIGPRGKKSANGRTWTREMFLTSFCNELYPNLSPEARDQYERILGPKVYSYLTNHSARGSAGVQTKPLTVKHRIYGHDVWRCENPELFEQRLAQYRLDNPDVVINIGRRRALISDAFRQLPEDEQEKYWEMAKSELKTMQALHALSGDNRTNYILRFKTQFEAMLKECDSCASIKINVQVLYEDASGDFHIETFLTECMSNLEDAPEIDEVVRLLKDWVKATAGKNIVKDGVPIATVYPDPNAEHDLHPCIPAIIGLKALEMQKVFRLFMKAVWIWQGGKDKVPWERISVNLDDWIPAAHRPFGSPLGDPGELRLSVIITWIEYIQQCQSGAILPEKHVQYSQVIAGVSPIDPSLSQESSRQLEFIPQQNREVWILEFSDTITRCHAPGGIQYPKASIEYGEYLKRPPVIRPPLVQPPAEVTSNIATRPARVPNEFLGLPTGDAHPTSAKKNPTNLTPISGKERFVRVVLIPGQIIPDRTK
ncbi:hypothetical protein BDV93DRAFT_515798 [Ceratobasidium sp. AG-I]|nr:hypothetical protein BDV93DRAFT_515798 [Ceratobasidium sp. AG-I]